MTTTYSIGSRFDQPFFSGGAISSDIPFSFPCALNGRAYMLDTLPDTYYVKWNTETIPLLRQQVDQSNAPAEQSLNPGGLWRRAQDSWHHGAGQTYRDRDDSADKYRYRTSKGVDPWTKYQISLLNDTTLKKSSANTNLYAVVAGSRIYMADGSTVKYSTDMDSWSTVSSYTGAAVQSITTDGYTVYWCDGADIWTTNTGASSATSADTTNATLVRYVKGRLMVGASNVLYNIPTLGSAATMTYTHPSSQFTWVDCCEGNQVIFAAGYIGDKSMIYRTAIKADGTALDIPVMAGALPDGEIVRSIQGYLGYVWVGSDKGVRFCEVDANNNLVVGPLISTSSAVRCFEPQDRFMWFGWTNYDATSTGLGRMDITSFVDTDQPAYASDLMATTQGTVSSAATFLNLRVFTVNGAGLYAESSAPVTSGTIDSGLIGYGLPDAKTAVYVDVKTAALVGSYSVGLATDGGTFTTIGSESASGDTGTTFPTSQASADFFEIRLTLTKSGSTSPTILRWTLKALPTPDDGPAEILHIPILLAPVVLVRGAEHYYDVNSELNEISTLRASRDIVTLQLCGATYTGIVADFRWFPYGLIDDTEDGSFGMKGTCLVDFQRIN